jgi:hypothetical protein
MAGTLHETAPHHLPPFITPPGETDTLFVFIVVSIIVVVLLIGNFYFKLHALPEKMAHGSQSTQFQLVGILALLALFTHNNLFWIAALLIAALKLPDYSTPLNAIAEAVAGLSARGDRLGHALEERARLEAEDQPTEPAQDAPDAVPPDESGAESETPPAGADPVEDRESTGTKE